MNNPNDAVKKRQTILIVSAITGILTLIAAGLFYFQPEPTARKQKPTTVKITAPGSIDDKDQWRALSAAQVKNTNDDLGKVTNEVKKQDVELDKLKSDLAEMKKLFSDKALDESKTTTDLSQTLPATGTAGVPTEGNGKQILNSPLDTKMNPGMAGAMLEPKKKTIDIIEFSKPTGKDGSADGKGDREREVLGFPVDEKAVKYSDGSSAEDSEEAGIEFIPGGTFVRVSMLNGVDAPTGGQAQSNPVPIIMHVMDQANMANKYKLDVRDCRFIVAAWGDLSSERTLGRTETLSCVIDGEAVEIPVKGMIIGEDGKYGLRGRLVTKQGSLLANAFAAGLASGIGKGFSQSAQITSSSPLGVTQTVDPDKIAQAGLGSGFEKAADRLSKYYIDAADKMFPVIETDGGRIVEIALTKGAVYKVRKKAKKKLNILMERGISRSRENVID